MAQTASRRAPQILKGLVTARRHVNAEKKFCQARRSSPMCLNALSFGTPFDLRGLDTKATGTSEFPERRWACDKVQHRGAPYNAALDAKRKRGSPNV